jgi:hypothetical protein
VTLLTLQGMNQRVYGTRTAECDGKELCARRAAPDRDFRLKPNLRYAQRTSGRTSPPKSCENSSTTTTPPQR